MSKILITLSFLAVFGCASEPPHTGWRMPDGDENSKARGEAFAGDGMHFRKDMPHQEDVKTFDFYFKHCSMNGNETYYSKTSYDCNGPF